ncbi:hypothetical protein [Bathymodiolus japonicus methanotrophic gill symbiont]|nr:hypothetical protein [Bathymodiolus japonicus methanotrophic gill symbiont]
MDKKTPLLHPGERGELEGLMKRFGVDARYDEMLNAPAIKGVPGVEGK